MTDMFQMISRLQADYCRCIDDGDLDRWPELFVEDCIYRITTADNVRQGFEIGLIAATSRGMLLDRVSALRQANIYERHCYRHIIGQPAILDPIDGVEGQRCQTSFLVLRIMQAGAPEPFASGSYHDRYRTEGDAVKLIERIVVCDNSRFDTLLALPL
jgi:anthranilate 1,2-dioxygenase small subunit